MPDEPTWISTPEEVSALRAAMEVRGQKLVFTNGVFDLLHVGHVRYLREARALGDALIIALNSDDSVRTLKGPTRPVNTQADRAEILRALACVDRVVVFDEPRVTSLIEAIKPHIYTKGGDYTVESLNPEERAALQRVGADIRILPMVEGKSTTATLSRLRSEGVSPSSSQGQDALATNSPLRLGVLGSGVGRNFESILRAINNGSLNAKVEVVISDVADSGILQKARAANLPAIFVDPGDHPRRFSANAQKEVCDHFKRHNVQVVVLGGFMRVLKEPVLSEFAGRIMNIHPSLLPKFKGVAAWEQALNSGDSETGCTVHLVNAELDSGDVLAQAKVPILPGDTAESLYARIQEQEHRLLPKVLGEWRERGLPAG